MEKNTLTLLFLSNLRISVKGITWTSSNNAVASLEEGPIKGNSAGTAVISARTADGVLKHLVPLQYIILYLKEILPLMRKPVQ